MVCKILKTSSRYGPKGMVICPGDFDPHEATEMAADANSFWGRFKTTAGREIIKRGDGAKSLYLECENGTRNKFGLTHGPLKAFWTACCFTGGGISALPDFLSSIPARVSHVVQGLSDGDGPRAGEALAKALFLGIDVGMLVRGGRGATKIPNPINKPVLTETIIIGNSATASASIAIGTSVPISVATATGPITTNIYFASLVSNC